MRVGITGGLGFIGGHLVRALQEDPEVEITVFDNYHRALHIFPEGPNLHVIRGDIRNPGDLQLLHSCEVIINLAAESSVMRAEANPNYAWATNVQGVCNLIDLCLQYGMALIHASSREVYGEVSSLPVAEDRPTNGKNVYGQSKAMAEEMLLTARQHGLNISIHRYGNVIGANDDGRLLPNWLRAVSRGLPLQVFGGSQIIDFIPVETVVKALILTLKKGGNIGPVNIASGTATSLLELARRFQSEFGVMVEILPARAAEVTGYQADVTKMVSELGLSPPDDPLASLAMLASFYS